MHTQPFEMRFRGVTTFEGDKVVYAQTDPTHAPNALLGKLAHELTRLFQAAGLTVTDADSHADTDTNGHTDSKHAHTHPHGYSPHLSILRLSKMPRQPRSRSRSRSRSSQPSQSTTNTNTNTNPKRVDKSALDSVRALDCGRQAIGSLDLLAMSGGKQVRHLVLH